MSRDRRHHAIRVTEAERFDEHRRERTYWAHFEFIRMNIEPIILRKQIEDAREVHQNPCGTLRRLLRLLKRRHRENRLDVRCAHQPFWSSSGISFGGVAKPWRTCQKQAIYAASRINQLRTSSSAASQLRKYQ